jgi:hypothetical protein
LPTTKALFSGTIQTSTAASVSNTVAAASESWIGVVLDVTDVQGAGASAVFHIQWSLDGATWADAQPRDAFDPITAPCTVAKRFDAKAPYWRAAVDISGTSPSFTGSANSYS